MNSVSTFIFSSSAAVYGNKTSRCNERDIPKPQSPYATSKLEGERLCKEYALAYKMNTASLRYFNVYGNRQNPHGAYAGVVAKFTYNLLHEQPIVIYGDGTQRRDFIHVSEVTNANLLIGTKKALHGEVCNIATGRSITLLELLNQLEEETNKKHVGLQFEPARPGDIVSSSANCKIYKTLAQNYNLSKKKLEHPQK